MLFHHTDDVTEWLQVLQWDESPLQVSDIMLDLPTPRCDPDTDRGKAVGAGAGVGAETGCLSSSGDLLGTGMGTGTWAGTKGGVGDMGGRIGTSIPGVSGVNAVLTEFPTPRSLVIAISGNIIRTMSAYRHVHQSTESSTNSGTGGQHPCESESSFQFSRASIVDQGNSNISAPTLKKLLKLSQLPQQRENLDFLSASFPYLDVKNNSPKQNEPRPADFEEEEEDEI